MAKNFLWVDLEMTGLDEKTDHILEIAAVVTDQNLKPLGNFHRIVFQPKEILDAMNDWCKQHHGASGLTQACSTGTELHLVEAEVLTFLNEHFQPNEKIVLCGNSIWNDRRFIEAYLKKVSARLHYRMVDVSSFKEIFRERYGMKSEKGSTHRAIDDINESIKELEFYLSFVKTPGT